MSDEWIKNNLGSADVMFAELMAMQEAENNPLRYAPNLR